MMQAAAVNIADEGSDDAQWARDNLRQADGRFLLDVANVLRIIELHPDFKGRFKYNDTLNKVVDGGAVVIEWRVSEWVAQIQERFLPGVPFEIAYRALVVAGNKASQ